MNERSPVFEENYQHYLERLAGLDLPSRADILGAEADGDGLVIPFFQQPCRVSSGGLMGPDGRRPPYSTCIILFKYVLLCPQSIPVKGSWASFRDFRDAGPLVVFFANEVEGMIQGHFAGRADALAAAAARMGGRAPSGDFSHDLSVQFDPLPRLSMLLLFNDRDEEFPARCQVLFEQRAEAYLDMESVAVLGHVLSQGLLELGG